MLGHGAIIRNGFLRARASISLSALLDVEKLKIDRGPGADRPRARRRRWLGPLLSLGVVALLLWLFQGQILGFVDSLRLPEVRVQRVTQRSGAAAATASGTSANGYIVARTRAALSADTPGRIVEMNVEEGSVVKKGEVVARLYADEYRAAVQHADADLALARTTLERVKLEVGSAEREVDHSKSAEKAASADLEQADANLALAETQFKRAQDLLDAGVDTVEKRDIARRELDSAKSRVPWAKANLETAQALTAQSAQRLAVAHAAVKEAEGRIALSQTARDQAQATLDKTEVRAPFDGIVVLKDAEVGEVVSPNVQGGSNARGSVVTMVDFATLEVQAEVPETTLVNVTLQAPARIWLDAWPDKSYPGRVDRIWPTANRSKATVEVRIVFLERDLRLRPEMGARVVFLDSAEPAAPSATAEAVILVPAEALLRVDGVDQVFVLERDTARLRKIELGEERSGRRVVKQGLADGETILLGPPPTLTDGQRVRVKG
jgi:RND family efflux transporter MFP subunit